MMGYDIKLYSRHDIKENFFWQFIKEKHYQRDCRLSFRCSEKKCKRRLIHSPPTSSGLQTSAKL